MPNLAAFNCQHKGFHLFSAQLPLATCSGGCASLNAHISISIRIMKRLGVHLPPPPKCTAKYGAQIESDGDGVFLFFFPRTRREARRDGFGEEMCSFQTGITWALLLGVDFPDKQACKQTRSAPALLPALCPPPSARSPSQHRSCRAIVTGLRYGTQGCGTVPRDAVHRSAFLPPHHPLPHPTPSLNKAKAQTPQPRAAWARKAALLRWVKKCHAN